MFLSKTPEVYEDKKLFPDLSGRELAVLLPLAAVTLLMGVAPSFAMDLYAGVIDGYRSTMDKAIEVAGVLR